MHAAPAGLEKFAGSEPSGRSFFAAGRGGKIVLHGRATSAGGSKIKSLRGRLLRTASIGSLFSHGSDMTASTPRSGASGKGKPKAAGSPGKQRAAATKPIVELC